MNVQKRKPSHLSENISNAERVGPAVAEQILHSLQVFFDDVRRKVRNLLMAHGPCEVQNERALNKRHFDGSQRLICQQQSWGVMTRDLPDIARLQNLVYFMLAKESVGVVKEFYGGEPIGS